MAPPKNRGALAELISDDRGRLVQTKLWAFVSGTIGYGGLVSYVAKPFFPAMPSPIITVEQCFYIIGLNVVYLGLRNLKKPGAVFTDLLPKKPAPARRVTKAEANGPT